MPYTITNVALDRRYESVRRRSYKLETEPYIAGRRLRVRRSMTLTDKQYRAAQPRIEELERKGILTISREGAEAAEELPFPETPSRENENPGGESTGEGTQSDEETEQQETSETEQAPEPVEQNEETEQQEPIQETEVEQQESEQAPAENPETQASATEQVPQMQAPTLAPYQQPSEGKPHKGKHKGKNKGRK